jgi:hypothetical protein
MMRYLNMPINYGSIRNIQLLNQPVCSLIDEWMNIMWYIYTINDYSVIKKNEIRPFSGKLMEWQILI